MQKDMAGKLVFGYGGDYDMTPCIYQDNGWYQGTKEEYNIRKVATIETFYGLKASDSLFDNFTDSYGSRWGGGFDNLYEITDEEIEAIKKANEQALKTIEAEEEIAENQDIEYNKTLSKSGICPKCGTWCYGDCMVNQ